jgi:transcriptional regulator with XRE-family HTH domain
MNNSSWIAKRRNLLGISQDELVSRLSDRGFKITRSTVSHWEKGRFRPPFDDPNFTRALAESLEMDVKNILSLLGYITTEDEEKSSRVIEIFDALPPEQQETALVILEQLLKRS